MPTPAIRVEKLSKRYQLGSGQRQAYRTLRDSVADAFAAPWRRLRKKSATTGGARCENRDFWALSDVSFDVEPGEVIGVIGRNGAGKSTFLKILSRITEPTSGQVILNGRVGSLLEVGTGFHPELTGRENIFLNGALLGMTRREIQRKFDAIVDFSEIEQFLDTPVKRYSSGMYVRLAFAVASHLEPEILIVDEVLAVGDAQFQQKCLGKMGDVSRTGRTVLFVSHNMSAVKSLCSRAVLLEHGCLTSDGEAGEVVNHYLTSRSNSNAVGDIPYTLPRLSNGEARFDKVKLTTLDNQPIRTLYFGQQFRVHAECEVSRDIPDAHFETSISTADGLHVLCATTIDEGGPPLYLRAGRHNVQATISATLLPNRYTIDLGVHHDNGTTCDFVQRTLDFDVLKVAEYGGDHYRWGNVRGLVRPIATWSTSFT